VLKSIRYRLEATLCIGLWRKPREILYVGLGDDLWIKTQEQMLNHLNDYLRNGLSDSQHDQLLEDLHVKRD